jgi:hypothetical protein
MLTHARFLPPVDPALAFQDPERTMEGKGGGKEGAEGERNIRGAGGGSGNASHAQGRGGGGGGGGGGGKCSAAREYQYGAPALAREVWKRQHPQVIQWYEGTYTSAPVCECVCVCVYTQNYPQYICTLAREVWISEILRENDKLY